MKEQLKKIVETIKISTGQTQEQIALNMGYKGNAISGMLSPTGKVTRKFINAITNKYKDVLSENGNIKGKGSISLISGQGVEQIAAIRAELRVLFLKVVEIESKDGKRSSTAINLELADLIKQETKRVLDELRNE